MWLHFPSARPPSSIAVSSGKIRVLPPPPRCGDQAQGRMLLPPPPKTPMVSMATGTYKVVHVAAKHIKLLLLFGLVYHSTCFLAGQLQVRWGSIQAGGSPDKNLSAPPWHYSLFLSDRHIPAGSKCARTQLKPETFR